MEFRTYNDLNHTIMENLWQIPLDVDLVVGVPRSGLMVASLIALYRNLPLTSLDDFLENRVFTPGTTKPKERWIHSLKESRKILIVEDSVSSGASIDSARQRIEQTSSVSDRCLYLAAYVTPGATAKVDIAL